MGQIDFTTMRVAFQGEPGAFSEAAAVQAIEQYYIELRGGRQSPTAEFFAAEPGLSFRQFNAYINSLDRH